jgi:hypothetical protein
MRPPEVLLVKTTFFITLAIGVLAEFTTSTISDELLSVKTYIWY